MISKKNFIDILLIFFLALVLRSLYFYFALQELSIEQLLKSIPDTGIYWTVANHFLEYNPNGEYWLFQVGPGYGAFLAMLIVVSGKSYYFIYIVHILIGSLISVLTYLIVLVLLNKRNISMLAGFFAAVSFTSITLSANILSDAVFMTVFCSGILFFIYGYKSSKTFWFVLAGLVLSLAMYIRAVAMFYPAILLSLPLGIKLFQHDKFNLQFLKKTIITISIMILFFIVWSARNYVVNDVFTFGGNGTKAARIRLAALAEVNHNPEKIKYKDILVKWAEEDSVVFNHRLPTFKEEYQRDKEDFIMRFKAHPDWIIKQFWDNIDENVVAGNYIPHLHIKRFRTVWDTLADYNKVWFVQLINILSFLGLCILIYQRNFFSAIFCSLHFLYFTLLCGFTMWQGSRIHFPAELSYGILSAVCIVSMIEYIITKFTSMHIDTKQ